MPARPLSKPLYSAMRRFSPCGGSTAAKSGDVHPAGGVSSTPGNTRCAPRTIMLTAWSRLMVFQGANRVCAGVGAVGDAVLEGRLHPPVGIAVCVRSSEVGEPAGRRVTRHDAQGTEQHLGELAPPHVGVGPEGAVGEAAHDAGRGQTLDGRLVRRRGDVAEDIARRPAGGSRRAEERALVAGDPDRAGDGHAPRVTATSRSVVFTPLVCATHGRPALVVSRMVPFSPTAQPVAESAKVTARRVSVVGEGWLHQVAPPSTVTRMLPLSPTAQPCCRSTNETPCSAAPDSPAACCVHVAPPSWVTSTSGALSVRPTEPTAQP